MIVRFNVGVVQERQIKKKKNEVKHRFENFIKHQLKRLKSDK